MHIHEIARSLKEITASTPAIAALLVGGLHHGARASLGALRPFGLLGITETGRIKNSSGVALASYSVTLDVVVDESVGTAGNILEMFHRYWDRITSLPTLNPAIARLVLIHPAESELGEAAEEDLGEDVLIGRTGWIIKLSEHQPELE